MYHSIRMGIGERKVRDIRILSALGQIAVGNLVSRIGSENFPRTSVTFQGTYKSHASCILVIRTSALRIKIH